MPLLTDVRYGYYDAMRGFTMLLVVFSHVIVRSIGAPSPINEFFCSFRMPLFFFVSGFFAYKAIHIWTTSKVKDILGRKFKVQIVGTTIFLVLYETIVKYATLNLDIFYGGCEGYWFTYVLFRIFLIYLVISLIFKRINQKGYWSVILVISIICIIVHNIGISVDTDNYDQFEQFFNYIITGNTIYFLPYFMLGVFSRSNMSLFESILSSDIIRLSCIAILILFWSVVALGMAPELGVIPSRSFMAYPICFVTLFLVIQIFFSLRDSFDKKNRFNIVVKFIGRRTLDIYFLHYFFLPNLHFMRGFFTIHDSAIVQLVLCGGIALIIVGMTLLVGQIIRTSPLLAEWLLGVKRKQKISRQ